LRTVHLKERKFGCQTCKARFCSLKDLKRHEAAVHVQAKPFYCKDCGKAFVTLKEVKKHRRAVHSKDKKDEASSTSFSCQHCSDVFDDILFLQENVVKLHNQRKTQCCICNNLMSDTSCLKRHIKFVHQKVRDSVCATCSKKFSAKAKLERHKNEVHLKRRFACQICQHKSYSRSDTMLGPRN